MKLEVGKLYVVKLTDSRNCDVVRELSTREVVAYHTVTAVSNLVKVVAILASIVFPPLLFITIPLFRNKG